MALLINKVACKKVVLEYAQKRSSRFTRVGSDVFEHLHQVVLNHIKSLVHAHPSIGKTIMMGSKKRQKKEDILVL